MANLWVRGVCDSMLLQVMDWQRRWESGAVAATRPFLGKDGAVEDVVTKRAVKVIFRPAELDHLVRILLAVRPEWEFSLDLEKFRTQGFSRGRLLTGNRRMVEMVSFRDDLVEIMAALVLARSGESKTVKEEISSGSFWDEATK
jgi:hypothetical protein